MSELAIIIAGIILSALVLVGAANAVAQQGRLAENIVCVQSGDDK